MPDPVIVSAAVEGAVDEAVVRKLIVHVGGRPGPVYGKKGKPHLYQKVNGYNNAARRAPWVMLVDLDRGAHCAPPLRRSWLAQPAQHFCFRVSVRAVEAWLIGDPETLAPFMRYAGQSREDSGRPGSSG